jgi:hypothetical protein
VADYTVSTNLISWIPAKHGIFGWPDTGQEAEVIRGMEPGDLIVPKFAQLPVHEDQEAYQRGIAKVFKDDWERRLAEYEEVVARGRGAVPFVMRVLQRLPDDDGFPSAEDWARVEVELLHLSYPLSTSEFLHLRAIPVEIAGQFKAMAAPNRHIQALPPRAGAEVLRAGEHAERGPEFLRRETLVRAANAAEAKKKLYAAGAGPDPLDRAFLVEDNAMVGLHVADAAGVLQSTGEPIEFGPRVLHALIEDARHKAVSGDSFRPARALAAAFQLVDFIESGADVLAIPELSHFHDRYVILPRKATEAMVIAARPEPIVAASAPTPGPRRSSGADERSPEEHEPEDSEPLEDLALDRLNGLSVTAVEAVLPKSMVLPASVLAEAVTAIRAGKHLIFSGPPGTGKSTIASAVSQAVMDQDYRVATATADWTTFDTIGGYLPKPDGTLAFEPGVVLRCIDESAWLVIDELNRADIDKAFGPMFTLLAGPGSERETVLLPHRRDGKHVEIRWADADARRRTNTFFIAKSWRLLGTMNVTDKASLYQLSFAFLRRFAVIDVPLPDRESYSRLFSGKVEQIPEGPRALLTDAAMAVAFGPIELGPAILLDIAEFTVLGVTPSSSGPPAYDDAVAAFITATRLYAVPQYEGADPSQVDRFKAVLREVLGDGDMPAWQTLYAALDRVGL